MISRSKKERKMKAVLMKMDTSEHCPECGALLVRDGRVSMCANCGYYSCDGHRQQGYGKPSCTDNQKSGA
jgi:uncharacterized Zn finger protein (UPF0148 family)